MDYEEFYCQVQIQEKNLKDNLSRQQTAFKSIVKNTQKGDLKSLSKDIAAMEGLMSEYADFVKSLKELSESFNGQEYMESGDFARQTLDFCQTMGVDVKGNYPVFEMFPYKVKIDSENQDVYIDRKKLQCLRPQFMVSEIKKSREKLMKTNFNASAFLNEMADAYDMLSKIKQKESNGNKRDLELLLKDIYRVMAPMQRFRRDYDMQSFAFDLSRLLTSDTERTKDGRQFIFGKGRNVGLIRLLDQNGNESFISTIRFFSNDNESR